MKTAIVAALLSLPLCFAAACAVSEPEESAQTAVQSQAVDGGCWVQLPLYWTGFGVSCVENANHMTIWLNYEQTYHAYASGNGAVGEAIFRCTPGPLVNDGSWCVASEGSPL